MAGVTGMVGVRGTDGTDDTADSAGFSSFSSTADMKELMPLSTAENSWLRNPPRPASRLCLTPPPHTHSLPPLCCRRSSVSRSCCSRLSLARSARAPSFSSSRYARHASTQPTSPRRSACSSFSGNSTRERYTELFSDSPNSYTSDASMHASVTLTLARASARMSQPSRQKEGSADTGCSSFPAN